MSSAIKEIKVQFKNDQRTFWPGQTVEGNIVVLVENTTKINGIHLELRGQEHSNWFGKSGRKHDQTHKVCELKHKFEGLSQLNIAGEMGLTLAAGEHKTPFSFKLPTSENLPSTFEGLNGSIRYFVKTSVSIPWSPNAESIEPVVIIPIVDCNLPDYVRSDRSGKPEPKKVCGGLWKIYPEIDASVSIPRRAYVAGEQIQCEVYIKNNSSKYGITSFLIQLVSVAKFKAKRGSSVTRYVYMSQSFVTNIPPNNTQPLVQTVNTPVIPFGITPPSFSNGKLINNSYILELVVERGGTYANKRESVHVPVIVGTVPYVPNFSKQ